MPDGTWAEARRTYYILPGSWEAARPMRDGDPVFYEYVAEERPSEEFFPWTVCDLDNKYGSIPVDVDFATRLRLRGRGSPE